MDTVLYSAAWNVSVYVTVESVFKTLIFAGAVGLMVYMISLMD